VITYTYSHIYTYIYIYLHIHPLLYETPQYYYLLSMYPHHYYPILLYQIILHPILLYHIIRFDVTTYISLLYFLCIPDQSKNRIVSSLPLAVSLCLAITRHDTIQSSLFSFRSFTSFHSPLFPFIRIFPPTLVASAVTFLLHSHSFPIVSQ
jgi:hypothetical protein